MYATESAIDLDSISSDSPPNVNIGSPALGVIWTLTIIASFIVVARCYAQKYLARAFGLSDILAVAASAQYHYGWGRHQIYVSLPNAKLAAKYNTIMAGFGLMGPAVGRMSFIVLMTKLFGNSTWRRGCLWALFWVQLVVNAVVSITTYVQCADIRSQWDFEVVSKCWPATTEQYIGYVHSAFNALSDLFLTILPAVMLWKLQMTLKTKLGLAFLLCLSFLASIAVVMKAIYLRALGHGNDYLFNTVPLFLWVVIEGTLVLIAASIALLRPLARLFRGDRSESRSREGYHLDNYGMYAKQSTGTSNHHTRTRNTNRIFATSDARSDSEEGIVKQVTFTVFAESVDADGKDVRTPEPALMKERDSDEEFLRENIIGNDHR